MKILVCSLTYKYVNPKVYENHIACISKWSKKLDVDYMNLEGSKICESRSLAAKTSFEEDYDYLFFIDSDHLFDYTALPYLVENRGYDVVSGLIRKRGGNREHVGFDKRDDKYYLINLPKDGSTYNVDIPAMGCTLIHTAVFNYLEEPFFLDVVSKEDGKVHQKRNDINFFEQVGSNGGILGIDTRVQVIHLGEVEEVIA